MGVIRRRNRMVYFRVTEDEFVRLHELCSQSGARSISDLARGAIQELLDSRTGRASERQAHEEILGRIEDLKAVIEDLNARLAGREAARHAGGANR